MKNLIRVVLPKQYNLVVGDTFQIFYRGVVEAPNPYCYDILSVCEKGKNYPRYFEFTPEEEGEYDLTISVYSADKTLIGQGTTLLKVSKPKLPQKPLNILCIGDSLTAGGTWVKEVHRRLCDDGIKDVTFIGTCKKDEVGFEGYGGWEWSNYTLGSKTPSLWVTCNSDKKVCDQHSLWKDEKGEIWQLETIDIGRLKFNRYGGHKGERPTGVLTHYQNAVSKTPIEIINTYDEKPNPFYDLEKGEVCLKTYCEKYGFEGIDIVYILLGANGLIGNEKPIPKFCEDVAKKAKTLIDIINRDYPKAQIRLMTMPVPSVNGGTGASYGAKLPYCDDYGLAVYNMELNIAYEKLSCEYVKTVNIPSQFDSEYNYPCEEKPVNARSTKTEVVGTNGLHPSDDGYMQIADAVYRDVVGTINNL